MESESGTMVAYSLPLLREVVRVDVRQRTDCITKRVGARDQFPSTFALDDPSHQALHTWSEIPASALGTELPCPHCGKPIKLNPFTNHADWRPIAKAWRGGGA